jgi:replicative DNA helicase
VSTPPERRRRKDRRQTGDLDERTLPNNLEAERAVLGSILLHNDAYVHAARHIGPADFFREVHREIFSVLASLLDQPNGTADLVSVKQALKRTGRLEDIGGPVYLSLLVDGVPRSMNVIAYAGIVREQSLLRQLITVGNTLVTDAYCAEEPAGVILNQADQAIIALQHGVTTGRMRNLAHDATGLYDDLEYRVQHQGELTGVDTGFASLNNETLGWQAGDMMVIAARPSIGKTAFVLNTAVAGARQPRPTGERRHIALFEMEMRRKQLEFRLLSALSGVPLTNIMRGVLYDAHWAPLNNAIAMLKEMNLHVDDTASRSVADIRAECRRLRSEHGLDLVIIDYIQLMPGTLGKKGATRNEEITDISRKLKVLADEVAAPVIVLSQLRRTGGARPGLEDLRESGSLEQDADIVGFLHRKNHRESGATEFIISKQRNGATGTVILSFNRETQQFTDVGEQTEEEATKAQTDEDQHAKTQAIIRSRARKRS